ncbi:MAG: hypothetical protein GYA24_01775 [Candidatus Lokiarchaeota archaeon]|nr:hypothetical protein [Candidatus Lokiarchaeota archaeon]
MKRSIAERDQAVEELTAKITGSEKIIAGLQRDIADKDDRVARLHQAIEEKEAAARDSKTAMERADARAGELKHAIEEKEKILDELKRGLEDSKGLAQKAQALGEMKALCEKQAGEIDTLRDKIVTMNQDLIEKEERYQQVSRSKEMINKELDAARRQCNELQAAIDALSGKNATLKERLAGLEEESNAKARLSEELTRLNDKLRLLEHDSGKVGELQGLLAKQASEIDAWKGKAEILATDLAERNKIIEELQHARQTLENQVKDTIASRTAADKQATDLKDVVEKQAAEIKALTDQIKGLNDSVAAKDTTIESLKQGIAVLKELQSKPRPLESMKEAIKQEADKLKASMAEKHDSELKGKYDALEKEMKHLLKFLEKSPKQQLLFLVSNLGTTSLDKLVEMTRFDEGLVRKILDDLADEKLIHVTPDAAATDPTRLSVKIVEKLNPIGYLDVKHAGLDPDITTRPLEQVLESQLDLVKTFQEFDPETAGYILATLYTRARERQDFASLRQLGAYIGSLKPRSFYLRLVDNLFSTTPGELQSDAASNATGTVPPLIKLDTANAELQENSDGYPKQAPFTVEKVWCISVIEEVERPDISKKARSFNTVTSLINWTWLAAKGGKIKVAIKDGTGRVFDIIVAPGKPRDAELLTKSFKSEAG